MTWLQALPGETEAGRAALADPAHWFIGPADRRRAQRPSVLTH